MLLRLSPVVALASILLPGTGSDAERKMGIETLAEFVSRVRNAKGLSLKDVERQSARRGPKIASSYVFRIENGLSLNPSKNRLISLARGLDEPEDLVFAAARGRTPANKDDGLELQLLAHFRELPDDYKEDLMKIARMLNAEHGAKAEEIKIVKKKPLSRTA
jgi:transcriptional regulator with XRE-family HTH domain